MSRRTWPEYLDDAATHLEASRAAIAEGRSVPPSPVRPVDPIPPELCDRAQALGLGYDILGPWTLSEARFVDRYA